MPSTCGMSYGTTIPRRPNDGCTGDRFTGFSFRSSICRIVRFIVLPCLVGIDSAAIRLHRQIATAARFPAMPSCGSPFSRHTLSTAYAAFAQHPIRSADFHICTPSSSTHRIPSETQGESSMNTADSMTSLCHSRQPHNLDRMARTLIFPEQR